jgi:hypothetical protein
MSVMQTLIIEVHGGMVQEVYSDAQNLRVVLVDWDAGALPDDRCFGGDLFVQPMSVLPNDTRDAVEKLTVPSANRN